MRIKRLSCSQFAGIHDMDVSFEPGLNVVVGENESGKSTLARLLANALFRDAQIGGRTRDDKEFKAAFFPAAFRDGREAGDFADGTVEFETERGPYVLSRTWSRSGSGRLRTPDGDVIVEPERIAGELKRELAYGEGVFNEILLSSHSDGSAALRTLLSDPAASRSGREVAEAVTRAFAESGGGVSISSIEKAIRDRISGIEGSHWDAEREAPVRKTGNGRWKQGIGEILKAYYAMEDAAAALDEAGRLEEEAKLRSAALSESEAACSEAAREAEEFQAIAGRLANLGWRREKMKSLEKSLKAEEQAADEWPRLDGGLRKAAALKEELRRRDVLDRFERVEGLNAVIAGLEKTLAGAPSMEDVAKAADAEERVRLLERRLSGMNLSALVRMEGGHSIEVRSIRTGKTVEAENGAFPIAEAVTVRVPGVMEMVLSPADMDVDGVKAELEGLREERDEIFRSCGVNSLEELRARESLCSRNRREMERAVLQRDGELRGATYEALREAGEAAGSPRPAEDLKAEVLALCGGSTLDAFIARADALIEKNVRDFASREALAERIVRERSELDSLEKQAAEDGDIPEKYRGIDDPDKRLKRLRENLRTRQAERDEALNARSAAMSRWETFAPDYDPEERMLAAKRKFNEINDTLKRWKHILEVFEKVKAQSLADPMRGLAERFAGNLGLIAGSRLSSELSERDGLNVSLYGGGRVLDYGKLSEGTKDTVALAFRLAVIDHLYPGGGGVAVLDDSLTDMDAPRMERSCRLIREFAERHQVLFLTCRKEYARRLGGNVIRLSD